MITWLRPRQEFHLCRSSLVRVQHAGIASVGAWGVEQEGYDSQEPEPRELREDELLERAARDLDLEVPEARDARGLRERRVRLQSRRSGPEVRRPLLGLLEELRSVSGRQRGEL